MSVWSNDNTVTMIWTAATDNGGSGMDGYAYVFNGTAGSVCDQGKDLEENITTVTSDTLADGTYYFHICTVDNAGNWTSTVNVGPFFIDTVAPAAGTVNDGLGPDIDVQTSLTTIAANWSGFVDAGSDIASYEWAIGTSAGSTDVQGYTNVGSATSASKQCLDPHERHYVLCERPCY